VEATASATTVETVPGASAVGNGLTGASTRWWTPGQSTCPHDGSGLRTARAAGQSAALAGDAKDQPPKQGRADGPRELGVRAQVLAAAPRDTARFCR